ncbi:MAG: lytic transglycosylase domain-containing protein [Thiotrichales bacterium]|nr:lytic transglycosylase domain-containing protein [Thiotrichales bacterium]
MRKLILAALISLPLPFPTLSLAGQNEVRQLIEQCTPPSHWKIMSKIVEVESSGHPYAIGVGGKSFFFKHKDEAEAKIRELTSLGTNFDIGLAQINSQHFKKGRVFALRGFSVVDALDPCTNLKMGAYILSDAYRRHQGDLVASLSVYNTGHPEKGLLNGYVEKYIP